jgi:DNA polymerase-3 subunit alpha (Gram-positive type)
MAKTNIDWSHIKDDIVFIDFETTGLKPEVHRVIEIGAIRFNKEKYLTTNSVDSFSSLIRYEKKLPAKIIELTGITDEHLKDGEDIKTGLVQLLEFIGNRTVLAYNAEFDKSFLIEECKRCGIEIPNTMKFVCVLQLAREALPGFENYKLATLAKKLGLVVNHRALSDCSVTFQVFVACFQGGEKKKLYRKYFGETPAITESPDSSGLFGWLRKIF